MPEVMRFYAVFSVASDETVFEGCFDTLKEARDWAQKEAEGCIGRNYAVLAPADYPNLYTARAVVGATSMDYPLATETSAPRHKPPIRKDPEPQIETGPPVEPDVFAAEPPPVSVEREYPKGFAQRVAEAIPVEPDVQF